MSAGQQESGSAVCRATANLTDMDLTPYALMKRTSVATKKETRTTLHDADNHEQIRVQGARENNLKDLSIEIPKRRLTVFTGVCQQ
jgi:excinuclease UvrABC ATPase subunit